MIKFKITIHQKDGQLHTFLSKPMDRNASKLEKDMAICMKNCFHKELERIGKYQDDYSATHQEK